MFFPARQAIQVGESWRVLPAVGHLGGLPIWQSQARAYKSETVRIARELCVGGRSPICGRREQAAGRCGRHLLRRWLLGIEHC